MNFDTFSHLKYFHTMSNWTDIVRYQPNTSCDSGIFLKLPFRCL